MSRKTIEIRMAWNLPNGSVGVQTGVYVFEDTTLKQVYDLVKDMENRPDFIEMDIGQFEEDDDGD